ncbi:kin of IRRE-like protein 3 isoform X2 [Scylla paramamosain]|uniref:kin of IRRE-like protein 3 isoform X2 n=1 Tax=Scylla paramamosain TaxID=85552 RepID=UPI0030831663
MPSGAAHRTVQADQLCPTCPYFLPTPTDVTTPVGIPANLTCGVRQLGDKKVSWIRRKDLHVLTTGNFTYTTDTRFRALHLPGSPFWSLEVDRPAITDSGVYECQVSTQPKIFRRFKLSVLVPSATITGTREIFMKAGSDINITCVVKGAIRGAPITWYHVLPRPSSQKEEIVEINAGGRGGVQLVTDKNSGTSWLLVNHATWRDAGNYTCATVHATPASVSVHVLDEAPAELHHDPEPSGAKNRAPGTPALPFLLLGLHRLLGRDGPRAWCIWALLAASLMLPTTPRGTRGLQDASCTSRESEESSRVKVRDDKRVLRVTLQRSLEFPSERVNETSSSSRSPSFFSLHYSIPASTSMTPLRAPSHARTPRPLL